MDSFTNTDIACNNKRQSVINEKCHNIIKILSIYNSMITLRKYILVYKLLQQRHMAAMKINSHMKCKYILLLYIYYYYIYI
jgi:hypothetical protein